MCNIASFLNDEAGSESAEWTVFALIIFLLVVVAMIPISNRVEFLWRGLLDILREVVDAAPEPGPAK